MNEIFVLDCRDRFRVMKSRFSGNFTVPDPPSPEEAVSKVCNICGCCMMVKPACISVHCLFIM